MFKQINSQFFNINSINGRKGKGCNSCETLHESIIEELQAKLAESAAIVENYWSRMPKLEIENVKLRQENLKLRQQNEAITIEND